jgi:hypothetical protein
MLKANMGNESEHPGRRSLASAGIDLPAVRVTSKTKNRGLIEGSELTSMVLLHLIIFHASSSLKRKRQEVL